MEVFSQVAKAPLPRLRTSSITIGKALITMIAMITSEKFWWTTGRFPKKYPAQTKRPYPEETAPDVERQEPAARASPPTPATNGVKGCG